MSGLLLAAALVASAFDLSCTAYKVEDGFVDRHNVSFVEVRIRVGLASDRWCDWLYTKTDNIARISNRLIILRDVDYEASEPFYVYCIHLESGKLEHYYGRLGMWAISLTTKLPEHACKRRPFSGFPARRF